MAEDTTTTPPPDNTQPAYNPNEPLSTSEQGWVENIVFRKLQALKFIGGLPKYSAVPTYTGKDAEIVFVDTGSTYQVCVYSTSAAAWKCTDNLAGSSIYELLANKDTDSTMAANSDTKYPSQKAVKTALATKLSAVSDDTAPSLGGNLNLNSKIVTDGGGVFYEKNFSTTISDDTLTTMFTITMGATGNLAFFLDYLVGPTPADPKLLLSMGRETGRLSVHLNTASTGGIFDEYLRQNLAGDTYSTTWSAGVAGNEIVVSLRVNQGGANPTSAFHAKLLIMSDTSNFTVTY